MARTAKKRNRRKPQLTATESRALLQKLPDDYLNCREVHWWVQIGFYYDENGDIRRLWECARCDTRKRNRMDVHGTYVGTTTYKHPAGYKIGAIRRVEVRGENIRRAKVYASESSMMNNAGFNNGNGKKKKVRQQLTYAVRHQQRGRAKASK